jgi:hypothetical protein
MIVDVQYLGRHIPFLRERVKGDDSPKARDHNFISLQPVLAKNHIGRLKLKDK